MRTVQEVIGDLEVLADFIKANEKNAKCGGQCPGATAYFDELVYELREAELKGARYSCLM